MTQRTAAAVLRTEMPYLREQFGVKSIALFGSFASGTARKNSDVDLLVEFDRPIGFKFVALSEHLEKLLGRGVDVLTPAGLKAIRSKAVAGSIRRSMKYV